MRVLGTVEPKLVRLLHCPSPGHLVRSGHRCKGLHEAERKISDLKWTRPFNGELTFKISLLILGFIVGGALLTFVGYTRAR
jgi:hypothetical protein